MTAIVREVEAPVESRPRSVLGSAAAGWGRRSGRAGAARSWECDASCGRRFQKSLRRASGCAGRGSIRLPAAGVAVRMFGRVRRGRVVSWSRYGMVRSRAAGWRALVGRQTST